MGGLIEQSSFECHGFRYSDVFKRVMEAVNNIDVGQFGAGSLPGVQAHVQTPKSRRIARMQKWPPTNFSVVFVLGRVLFCTIPE